MVGRQTPILALFVPLALVFIIDGGRGVRATLPAHHRGDVLLRQARDGGEGRDRHGQRAESHGCGVGDERDRCGLDRAETETESRRLTLVIATGLRSRPGPRAGRESRNAMMTASIAGRH